MTATAAALSTDLVEVGGAGHQWSKGHRRRTDVGLVSGGMLGSAGLVLLARLQYFSLLFSLLALIALSETKNITEIP